MLTIAISLLFALVATGAILSIIASLRNGIVRGRAILAELAMLEAGRRPAPAQRTAAGFGRLRPSTARAVVRRPATAQSRWQPGVAA